jgi:hypothetical protein
VLVGSAVIFTFTQFSTVAFGLAVALLSLFLALSAYKAARVRDWGGVGIALVFTCAFIIVTARFVSALF